MKRRRPLYARPVIVGGEQCAEAQPGPRRPTVELPGCDHGQNRGGSVCRQAVLVADRRRRRLPRRILGRRSERGQRRRAGRECQDACHAVRRRPAPTVWVRSRVQPSPVQPSGWPASMVQPFGVQAVRCPSRSVSKPFGVQAVRCPSRPVSKPSGIHPSGCLSHRVSAASALSASRSAVGSVRPGAGDAGGGLGRPAGPVSAAIWPGVVGLRLWPRSTG
jgi:hypothetical protein